MSEAPPKFWQPLPIWQVVLIVFVSQLMMVFGAVALREGLGLRIPVWIGSGVGGALAVLLVGSVAAAKRRGAQRR